MKLICRHFFCVLLAPALLMEFSALAQTITFSNSPTMAIPRRSSIILVVANGLGYGDLSCYGQAKFQTPTLDKLAADGIQFTNYSVRKTAPDTEGTLMLGKDSVNIPLRANDITVAKMLRDAGYHTGMLGEWDLGDETSAGAPWRQGFDEFAGYFNERDARNYYAEYIFRYAPSAIYDPTNKIFTTYMGKEMIYANTKGKNKFIPDVLASAACNFIKNNVPDDANHHRPFFLLLNLPMPGDYSVRPPSDAPYSDEPWPQPEKDKAAMISRIDGYIGQIREQLEKVGMTNNAAIFFTSDSISKKANGVDPKFFQSNANDSRVPMILFWPDGDLKNGVIGMQWSPKDFLPTAAEIGYAKTPEAHNGKSILSALGYTPH